MNRLFALSQVGLVKAPGSSTPRCGACKLDRGCNSPKMVTDGEGRQGIMICGEAPGAEEDERGIPFCGKTGQDLKLALHRLAVDMRRDCWILNAASCRPPRNDLPDKAVEHCRPNVLNEIRRLKPHTVILLGKAAVQSVIGSLWPESPGSMTRWAGWAIPLQAWNCWLCPTYHPSFVAREDSPVLSREWVSHLAAAVALGKRPWDPVPDYGKRVSVVSDVRVARDWLRSITADDVVCFDFETTTLKPDGDRANIICCAVCVGADHAFAFPWLEPAVGEMKRILTDPRIRKVGWSIKFESRWVRKKLGVRVKRWVFDGMLAAHALDSRRGITGLDFQAFVRLGIPDYWSHLEALKKSAGGNTRNRLHEARPEDLLRYAGLDALYEFMVNRKLAKELGVVW